MGTVIGNNIQGKIKSLWQMVGNTSSGVRMQRRPKAFCLGDFE